MPLAQYEIAGSLRDALGDPQGHGTVLFVPFGTDSRTEDDNVLLGAVGPINIKDLPEPYLLDEGVWTVTVSTTATVPAAGNRPVFTPLVASWTHDANTTWADIRDGAVSDVPFTPSLVQQAEDAAEAAQLAETNAETAAAAAQAVGTTNDTVIASRVNDSTSATRAALSATYTPRVSSPTRRPLPGVSMVSAMQTGHGWTSSGPGTWDLNHTADYALGSQSIKLTTDTASGNNILTLAGLTLDMTGKGFVIWVKVNTADIAKLGYLTLDAGNTGMTAYFRGSPFNYGGLKEPIKAGEWLPLMVPWAELETNKVGTPSRSTLTTLRFNIAAQNFALDVYLGGIGTYTEDPTYPNGVVSLTFDDSYAGQFTIARPKMSALGFAGTLFPITGRLDTAGYLTTAQVRTLFEVNGWEIAAHATSDARHVDLTTMSAPTLASELQSLRDWLDDQGYSSRSHAYPIGPFNATVAAAIAKHFATSRSTVKHMNTPLTTLPYRLESLVASNAAGTLLANAQSYIDQIAAGKGWGILTFHDLIPSGTAGTNQWTQADFNTLMDYIVTKGVAVRTIAQVMRTT